MRIDRRVFGRIGKAALLGLLLVACAGQSIKRPSQEFAQMPDSAWIDVNGPTLVGFYPIVSNAELDADDDLATVLDDFAYHFGTASDSLQAQGYAMSMRGGDTIWLRTAARRWSVVRAADSAAVGYLFADAQARHVTIYGVRTYVDLIEYGHAFRRTGRIDGQ